MVEIIVGGTPFYIGGEPTRTGVFQDQFAKLVEKLEAVSEAERIVVGESNLTVNGHLIRVGVYIPKFEELKQRFEQI